MSVATVLTIRGYSRAIFWRLRLPLFLALYALAPTTFAEAVPANNKQAFVTQLQTWLASTPAAASGADAVNDNRFLVPECDGAFTFTFQDSTYRTVVAECLSADWQRHIRLKTSKPVQRSKDDYQFAYVLQTSVRAEQPITADVLTKTRKIRRHVARNALDRLPEASMYAARDLRQGQILVTTDIYHAKYVAVARSSIPAGHPITPELLSLQKVTRKLPTDAVTDILSMKHLAANRLIHANAVLRKRDLKKAKLVQRGEQLILSAGSQSYSIEATAVALQDGYFGDQIRLRNLQSNQEVRAIVSGINRARALQ